MKNSAKEIEVTRGISLFTATSIVVANMIGAGIFTTTGIMAKNLPNPGWVLLCWIFGGLIAISGALCYAELATRMPEEGGEYIYLKKLYHPSFGFLTGWTSFFVGFSAPIAASALASIAYILSTTKLQISNVSLEMTQKIGAGILILIFTLVHYFGIKSGSIVQNILTVLKVGIVLGLAMSGILFGDGSFDNFLVKETKGMGGFAFGTAMMLVMFSYSGWNASAYIAGELKNPRKTLPLSLILGTGLVIILYLAINVFILYSTPFKDIQGTITVVEQATTSAFGGWMSAMLSFLIGFALFSSLSAFILIGPRVYFAMARDRLFFPFASRVHSRYRVPGRSIIIQGAMAIFMVIIGSFEQLVIYIGFALGIFPWLAVLGLFKARRTKIGEDTAVKTWGYPVVPIFFLLCSLSLMIIAYINRPIESSAAVLTVILGIPAYILWIKGFRISNKSPLNKGI
jgi:APA family basic amino acid/polyamine antiporter